MATLKGLFEQKPRNQRNFLLENKRDVKTKSIVNSQKPKTGTFALHKNRTSSTSTHSSYMKTSSHESSSHERFKRSLDKRHDQEIPSNPSKVSSRRCFPKSHASKPEESHSTKQSAGSTRTLNYIHQENVPFEWTEVCPSLISHNICHQGVQTENNEDEKYFKQFKGAENEDQIGASCDKKFNQILPTKFLNGQNYNEFDQPQNIPFNSNLGNNIVVSGNRSCEESTVRNNIPNTFSKPSQANNFQDYDCLARPIESEDDYIIQSAHDIQKPVREHLNLPSEGKSSQLVSDFENLKVSSRTSATNCKLLSNPTLAPSSYKKGVVPRYLSKRKTEQALASASARDIDPNCPPGHVVMPDNERRDTLDTILKNYNELIMELNRMPVRTDTLKMKQRKIEIEKQLDKFEEGIRVLSRSKVYVKLNA